MPKVNKKGTKSNVWNYVFTNVLVFYQFDFSQLFEFIISIAILCHFYRCTWVSTLSWFTTLIPHIFWISLQISCTHISISFLAFLHLLSAFPSSHSPIPHFGFYRWPAQFANFKIYFRKIVALFPKRKFPFVTTA